MSVSRMSSIVLSAPTPCVDPIGDYEEHALLHAPKHPPPPSPIRPAEALIPQYPSFARAVLLTTLQSPLHPLRLRSASSDIWPIARLLHAHQDRNPAQLRG